MSTKPTGGLQGLARDVRGSLRGHDPLLYGAGLTFYACIAILPMVLVSLWIAGFLVGHGTLRSVGDMVANALPRNLGVKGTVRRVVAAGTGLSWGAALASLLPSSMYGEGLRRAFDRLSRHRDENAAAPAWRGRALSLGFLAVGPLAVAVVFLLAVALSGTAGRGTLTSVLSWLAAFAAAWALISGLLMLAFRGVAPERPQARALLAGAATTGLVLALVLLAYLGFLRLPIHPGRAYGGIISFGALAVSAGWLYAAHVVVLVGYALTLELDARGGRPRAAVRRPSTGRRAA